jgi:hypothetical protein
VEAPIEFRQDENPLSSDDAEAFASWGLLSGAGLPFYGETRRDRLC